METVSIDIQYFTMIICCSLSVLGSGFIIVSSYFLSPPRPFYLRIVLFIAISDAVRSISFMIPCNKLDNGILIIFFAILNDSTFLIAILWSTYISTILYLAVVKSKAEFNKGFKYWAIISFVIIPLMNLLPIITKSHGCSSTVCTLKSNFYGEIWRSAIIYLPAWTLILISVIACVSIHIEIRKLNLDQIQIYLVKKLIYYPIILIIEFLPMSICSLLIGLNIVDDSSLVSVIAMNIIALHGVSNSIIYFLSLEKKRKVSPSLLSKNQIFTAKIDSNEFSSGNLLFGTFSMTSELGTK